MTSGLPVDPAAPGAVGVALASGGAGWEPPVIPLIEAYRSGLRLVRRCVDLADLLAVCRAGLVQVAVVSAGLARLDADDVAGLRAVGVSVLVVESSQQSGSALTLGATDVVGASVSPDVLVERIRRCAGSPSLRAERAAVDPPPVSTLEEPGHGRVVAVCSAAGSPGRSTLAVGAAGLLARSGRLAMLVDADVAGGAVGTLLGMVDDTPGLPAACRSAARGRLDPAVLAAHAVAVSAELRVLTAAPRPDRWRELRPSALRTVLGTARSLADVVVVDCGAGLPDAEEHSHASTPGAVTAAVLAEADVVLLVASADPVGMVRLGHLLESVDLSTMDASPAVVVTRVRGSVVGRHPEAQVRQTLARLAPGLPAYLVPDDPVAVDRAARRGQPVTDVAPESGLARALEALVTEVVDPEQAGGPASSIGRRPRPARRWSRRGRSIA